MALFDGRRGQYVDYGILPINMSATHKAGFVNIIGNPNVGKSTLMNALVVKKLSIITSKAQTTRHRIMGIVNGPDYQIVYSDTPGIIKPYYLLQKNMMEYVESALADADILLYVTDVVEKLAKNPDYIEKLNRIKVPVLVVLNKIDKSSQAEVLSLMDQWHTMVPKAEIFPVSALKTSIWIHYWRGSWLCCRPHLPGLTKIS